MASKELTNAAKAIYESRNGAGCRPWPQLPAIAKAAYLDDAEAARKSFLAALQEPTERMEKAAFDEFEVVNPMQFKTGTQARNAVWRAMINASPLGEQSK